MQSAAKCNQTNRFLVAGKAASDASAANGASAAEEAAAVAKVVRLRRAAALYTREAGDTSITAIDYMAETVPTYTDSEYVTSIVEPMCDLTVHRARGRRRGVCGVGEGSGGWAAGGV